MSTKDGSVLGTTQLVDNGPSSERFDLVIMGDGYQTAQLAQFHTDTQAFVTKLFATAPFDDPAVAAAINVHRVDVCSTDSGADDPRACTGGTGATARTYFDASFCHDGQIQRLLEVDEMTALSVAGAQVPELEHGHGDRQLDDLRRLGRLGRHLLACARRPTRSACTRWATRPSRWPTSTSPHAGCGVDTDRNQHPRQRASPAERDDRSSRHEQVGRPDREHDGASHHGERRLHAVRSPSQPGRRGHGGNLRGRALLPLRRVPPAVQLPHAAAGPAVLRRLPAPDPPDARALQHATGPAGGGLRRGGWLARRSPPAVRVLPGRPWARRDRRLRRRRRLGLTPTTGRQLQRARARARRVRLRGRMAGASIATRGS